MKELPSGIVEFGSKVRQNRSALVLIVANLVPLGGVMFAHWSAFQIVWLFWFENVIIGGFNVLKMLTVGFFGTAETTTGQTPPPGVGQRGAHRAVMAFMAAFFAVHYGGFCLGHGVFIVALLGKESGMGGGFSPWDRYAGSFQAVLSSGLGLAILVLFASHAFSFVANFLVKREYTRTGIDRLMFGPYARVVMLHVAILFGAFFVLARGSPLGTLSLLVLFKTGFDLVLHLKEREHSGAIPILLAFRNRHPR